MVEEAEYMVRATLTVCIPFSPIERETPLTRQDAIANAIGTMRDGFWDELESEGWTIEFAAEKDEGDPIQAVGVSSGHLP